MFQETKNKKGCHETTNTEAEPWRAGEARPVPRYLSRQNAFDRRLRLSRGFRTGHSGIQGRADGNFEHHSRAQAGSDPRHHHQKSHRDTGTGNGKRYGHGHQSGNRRRRAIKHRNAGKLFQLLSEPCAVLWRQTGEFFVAGRRKIW